MVSNARKFVKDWEIRLNDEQISIIETLDDPNDKVVVGEAVPGSGKTSIIVSSIHYLLHGPRPVKQREILSITYNTECAEATRQRLAHLSATSPLAFKTLSRTTHSLGWEICRKIGFSDLAKDNDELMNLAINKYESKFNQMPPIDSQTARQYISFMKNRGAYVVLENNEVCIRQDTLKNIPEDEGLRNVIINLFICYEAAKENMVDFDDMISIPSKLFELWKGGFSEKNPFQDYRHVKYLFVDELQDFNQCQMNMIQGIREVSGCKVIGVGDRDQAIYSWRGANDKNIEKFVKDFNAKLVSIPKNYRSGKSILDAASSIIRNNTDRHDYAIVPGRTDIKDRVIEVKCSGPNSESMALVQMVKSLLTRYSPRKIFILGRTNSALSAAARTLHMANIPITAKLDDFKNEYAQVINCIAAIIGHPNANMRSTLKLIKHVGESRAKMLTDKGCDLDDIRPEYIGGGKIAKRVSKFIEKLKSVRSKFAGNDIKNDFVAFQEICYSVRDALFIFIDDYASANAINMRMETSDVVQRIIDMASYMGPIKTLDQLYEFEDLDITKERMNCVELMTAHRSKGLENDAVIIIDGDNFPCMKSEETDDNQESNLLFVAMTRAKEYLAVIRYPKKTFSFTPGDSSVKSSSYYDEVIWDDSVDFGSEKMDKEFPDPGPSFTLINEEVTKSDNSIWPDPVRDYISGEDWERFKRRLLDKAEGEGMALYPSRPPEGWENVSMWPKSMRSLIEYSLEPDGVDFLCEMYPDMVSKGIKDEKQRDKLKEAWMQTASWKLAKLLGDGWLPDIFGKSLYMKQPSVQKDIFFKVSNGNPSTSSTETYRVASLVLTFVGHPKFKTTLFLKVSDVRFSFSLGAKNVISFMKNNSCSCTGLVPVILWRGDKAYSKSVKAGEGFGSAIRDFKESGIESVKEIERKFDSMNFSDFKSCGVPFDGHTWVHHETDCIWPIHPSNMVLIENMTGKLKEVFDPPSATKMDAFYKVIEKFWEIVPIEDVKKHIDNMELVTGSMRMSEMEAVASRVFTTPAAMVSSEATGKRHMFVIQRNDQMTMPEPEVEENMSKMFGKTVKFKVM
jgi:DNA helicase II / ATP-dependent DNA helicase PcrA